MSRNNGDNLVDFKYLLAEAAHGSGDKAEADRLAKEALLLKPKSTKSISKLRSS